MEAKDNQGNKKNKTKRAATILLSFLAFIGMCVGLAMLVSPGKIWSGYVGVVNAVLLAFLALSMFCMAVTEPTLRIGKTARIMISKWLLVYSATIFYLFLANGWWEPENIGIIYRWILEPMGLYSEGHLTGKILGLIFIAGVMVLLLHIIKHIIYKVIDNIETQSGGGRNRLTALFDRISQRNRSSGKAGNDSTGTTPSPGGKGGGTDDNHRNGWKHWDKLIIMGLVILVCTLIIDQGISEIISTLVEESQKLELGNALGILSFLIGFFVSALAIAILVITSGFTLKTIITLCKNVKRWIDGKDSEWTEWVPGFISWPVSIGIVFWITKSTSIDKIIEAFASKLSGIEPVKTFIAIILALFVVWFLQEVIRIFIVVAIRISGKEIPEKASGTEEYIVADLEEIFKKLIKNALGIINGVVGLTVIIPNFATDILSLIDSGENNPDEIEEIIVKSKKIVLEKDPESEAFHVDLNNYYADLYDEYIKNSKLTNEPTDDSDEKEPSEDNSSEEEN